MIIQFSYHTVIIIIEHQWQLVDVNMEGHFLSLHTPRMHTYLLTPLYVFVVCSKNYLKIVKIETINRMEATMGNSKDHYSTLNKSSLDTLSH